MIKLLFLAIFFFIGYFLADTKLIDIPFKNMPYIENLYEITN